MAIDMNLYLLRPEQVAPGRLATLLPLLSTDEQAHAATLQQAQRRQQWMLTRALLRRELSRLLPKHPLQFSQGPHGKPVLADGVCHFNVSHSGQWLVLALCRQQAVGVDLEFGRSGRDPLPLARRFFAPGETAWLTALPPEARQSAFIRLWARKEAILKAHGGGLAAGLEKVAFNPEAGWALENRLDHHPYHLSDSPFAGGWLAVASPAPHRITLHWLDEQLEIQALPPHLGINL